ncbi:hypothetical protein [Streptomyces sp. NRRL F-5681]|uniref:hypothetical protein n=1 Tax=Streptomyces sp. NRRL F-5681 TaxID=1463869 RepID=UPI0004C059E6|nr:hypothetical protein [Streptomyces sp. NRRL F-5681]
MKQSAARTLGGAALVDDFAAAGTASAAALPLDTATSALPTAALPIAGSALGTATQSLPVQDTATKLLGSGQTEILNDATAPAKGLLGGLPAGGVTTSGLSTNGLPLGG